MLSILNFCSTGIATSNSARCNATSLGRNSESREVSCCFRRRHIGLFLFMPSVFENEINLFSLAICRGSKRAEKAATSPDRPAKRSSAWHIRQLSRHRELCPLSRRLGNQTTYRRLRMPYNHRWQSRSAPCAGMSEDAHTSPLLQNRDALPPP